MGAHETPAQGDGGGGGDDAAAWLGRLEAQARAFEPALEAFVARLGGAPDEPVANLGDGIAYALGLDVADRAARGKRLRPAVCLATCEALGGRVADAMPFALGIELMHNFALIHDDIEDGDHTRRGRDAVWVKYGLAHGVNIGDYALVQVFRALADDDCDAQLSDAERMAMTRLMVETLDHTHRGQALDINARTARRFSLADYERIAREKTGHYFAAPFVGGAMAACADAAIVATLAELGPLLGPLFQIRDDVIDLTEGKGREAPGSDIREGKRSFLVAWTLERAPLADQAVLRAILDTPRADTSEAMIDEVKTMFERHGAFAAAAARIDELRAAIRATRSRLPPLLASFIDSFTTYLAGRAT